jgi:hypothetical protein
MLQTEIVQQYIMLFDGGLVTDESILENPFLADRIDTHRLMAMRVVFGQTKHVHPMWIQTYKPVFSEVLQEDENCFVKFNCPVVVTFSDLVTGLQYIGPYSGMCSLRTLRHRGDLVSHLRNPAVKKRKVILFTPPFCELHGQGDITEELRIEAVFEKPSQVPTFNRYKSDYPITEDLLPLMFDLWKKDIQAMKGVIPDFVPDTTPTTSLPKQQ